MAENTKAARRPRRFQFSLLTLLAVVTLLGVLFAGIARFLIALYLGLVFTIALSALRDRGEGWRSGLLLALLLLAILALVMGLNGLYAGFR